MGVEMKTIHSLNNQRGLALIETLPLLVVFIMLMGFALGLFGVVHTSVLHSIGARTYNFETFRNRANLAYFREEGSGIANPLYLGTKGWRWHGVQAEEGSPDEIIATARDISFGRSPAAEASEDIHNSKIFSLQTRNRDVSVSPVWVMVGYGMCLNAECGN